MENTCFCCKKDVDGFSMNLTNGYICRECYEKVKAKNSRITYRNIGMYSGEEIINIINPVKKSDVQTESSEMITENEPKEETNETNHGPNEEDVVDVDDDDDDDEKSSPLGIVKTIGKIAVAIVLFICIINPGFLGELVSKFVNQSGSVYVEMVQTLQPLDNTTYYDAFEGEFDNNEWSYFKSGEKHIVQVVSSYDDIDEEMITQFLLTPQGNDQFYIEVYAINVAGRNLSSVECTLVIAELFEGDVSEAIFEALLYGN